MAVLRELWPDTEVFLGWVSSMFWSHWKRGLPALQFLKKKKRKRKEKKRKKREKSWRTCARTLCTREQRTAMMMPLQNLERRHQRSFWNILKKTGPTVEKCGWKFPERRCSIIMGNRTTNRVEFPCENQGICQAQFICSCMCLNVLNLTLENTMKQVTIACSVLWEADTFMVWTLSSCNKSSRLQPYAAIIIISEMKESCKMTTVSCIPSEHNDNSVEVNSHAQLKWVEQCHAAAQLSVHPACFAVTLSSQNITSKRTFTRRWTQAYNKMRTAAVQHVDVARVEAKKNLSRTEKFRELNRVLKDTADMSADLGYTVLSTLWDDCCPS